MASRYNLRPSRGAGPQQAAPAVPPPPPAPRPRRQRRPAKAGTKKTSAGITKPKTKKPKATQTRRKDSPVAAATGERTLQQKVGAVLELAYSRAISPIIDDLKKAKSIADIKTYGEMNAAFTSTLLDAFHINPSSSFVDLGSGVGNVALQAHLETGCFALGTELDQERHEAALKLRAEAKAILENEELELENIDPDELDDMVRLLQGDVFEDNETRAAVAQADLIFSNNIRFGTALVSRQEDEVLVRMKRGAAFVATERVVRGRRHRCEQFLKQHRIEEEEKVAAAGSVSWTDKPWTYYVYKKEPQLTLRVRMEPRLTLRVRLWTQA